MSGLYPSHYIQILGMSISPLQQSLETCKLERVLLSEIITILRFINDDRGRNSTRLIDKYPYFYMYNDEIWHRMGCDALIAGRGLPLDFMNSDGHYCPKQQFRNVVSDRLGAERYNMVTCGVGSSPFSIMGYSLYMLHQFCEPTSLRDIPILL